MRALSSIALFFVFAVPTAVAQTPLQSADRLWSAGSTAARDALAQEWLVTEPEFAGVKNALANGRQFSKEAPTGYLENMRDQSFLLDYGEKDRLVPIEHIRRYMAPFRVIRS